MRKKIKLFASTVSVAVLSFPVVAGAQLSTPSGTGLPEGSIYNIIKSVMNWLLGLVGILGVIGFAIAGVLYLTAAGDEGRIDTAKKAMTWSIVGIVVALLGLVVLKAAQGLLGGSSTTF